jgi:hypothetical protein
MVIFFIIELRLEETLDSKKVPAIQKAALSLFEENNII